MKKGGKFFAHKDGACDLPEESHSAHAVFIVWVVKAIASQPKS